REGIEVERQPRQVTILRAELLAFRPGEVAEAELDVLCGKGTYMRVLAADLGDALGPGGLLAWLERTGYGPLTLADAVGVEELAAMDDPAAALLPREAAVSFLPRLDLAPPLAVQVRRGQAVWAARPLHHSALGTCRAHAADGELR